MNKELVKQIIVFAKSKGGFPYLSLIGGVVQTLETNEGDEDNIKIFRQPVTEFFETESLCDRDKGEISMMPDSSHRGIMYFEDQGSSPNGKSLQGATGWTSRLECVVWYNRNRVSGKTYDDVTALMIADIIGKTQTDLQHLGSFIGVNVKVTGVQPQNVGIFSKYTYDEKFDQYLRPPYDYFALSMEVDFFLDVNCFDKFEIKEELC